MPAVTRTYTDGVADTLFVLLPGDLSGKMGRAAFLFRRSARSIQ
jgi:hypothetical protein